MEIDRTLVPSLILAVLAAVAITVAPALTDGPGSERPSDRGTVPALRSETAPPPAAADAR